MKKLSAFMLSGIALFAAATANAEDYNRVAISYDNVHFGANKEMKADFFNDAVGGFSTNGVGLNYIHGFGLSESLPHVHRNRPQLQLRLRFNPTWL